MEGELQELGEAPENVTALYQKDGMEIVVSAVMALIKVGINVSLVLNHKLGMEALAPALVALIKVGINVLPAPLVKNGMDPVA